MVKAENLPMHDVLYHYMQTALCNRCNYSVQQHQALPRFSLYSCRGTVFPHLQERESSIASYPPAPLDFRKLNLVFEGLAFISWKTVMLYTEWKMRTTKITIIALPLGLQSNKTYCTQNMPADITTVYFCDECKDWFKAVILHILCVYDKGEGY